MEKKQGTKRQHPILTFFFVVVVPLAVLTVIGLGIAAAAGVDVTGWIKEKAGRVAGTPQLEEKTETPTPADQQQMDSVIADKDEEIEQLNEEISGLEFDLAQLKQEILQLEKNQERQPSQNEEAGGDNADDISKSFRNMDEDQAAAIMESMETSSAVLILEDLSSKERGRILGEITPERAAELTQLMMEND
ncbi:MotE family protein [Virgibacillus sediminis]|uniref:MotE family protein n=1 Tax=Virgibacillus sediminis TaxID=202260 RepID=A0ABV7AAE7_9BACI